MPTAAAIAKPHARIARNHRVGIVGTGVMGRGIAQILAEANATVLLHDAAAGAAARAAAALTDTWKKLAERGKIAEADVAANGGRISVVDSLDAFNGCDIVIEAIIERLDAKRALFKSLEAVVGAETILATNTSSLSVTEIAAGCADPGRVAGLHFFNPVPLMRIVEIIGGVRTRPETVERLQTLVAGTRHAGVVVKDTPGFLINHAGRGYGTEALRIVGEGVTDFVGVDRIMREQVVFPGGGRFKLGPFELLDVTGLDVSQPVMESIYRQFFDEPRFRPSVIGAQRAAGGLFGRKSGEGFYRYGADGKPVAADATAGAAGNAAKPAAAVPVAIIAEPHAPSLAALVERLGGRVVDDPAATDGGFVLIAPLGDDASGYAAARRLPAERVVAIDTLFDPAAGDCSRRVLMPTVATRPDALNAAVALFGADGVAVTRLRDSTGFVAQRIIAMIVSIATEIAQQRIAGPADIDLAVRAGLGYPLGPLAIGDAIGPARVLQILTTLHARSGDPRYRPGTWLRRRAELGLSLLVED
ncbi:MAG: 3-hydroxyacyl-CoA dehydrogenase [Lautropia sp.]